MMIDWSQYIIFPKQFSKEDPKFKTHYKKSFMAQAEA
jgi:hypothetical protein